MRKALVASSLRALSQESLSTNSTTTLLGFERSAAMLHSNFLARTAVPGSRSIAQRPCGGLMRIISSPGSR